MIQKFMIGAFLFILFTFIGGCSYTVSVYNNCVDFETGIEAQYEQNKNNYDNMFKKIKEVAQVTEKYSGDLKELFDKTMTGRYGKNGSKAMFQWIKENNPKLDASVYKTLQNIIAGARTDFEHNQKTLISKKQKYKNYRRKFLSGMISKMMGYPKINLDKMGIVTSTETEEVFKTKKAEPVKVFN